MITVCRLYAEDCHISGLCFSECILTGAHFNFLWQQTQILTHYQLHTGPLKAESCQCVQRRSLSNTKWEKLRIIIWKQCREPHFIIIQCALICYLESNCCVFFTRMFHKLFAEKLQSGEWEFPTLQKMCKIQHTYVFRSHLCSRLNVWRTSMKQDDHT